MNTIRRLLVLLASTVAALGLTLGAAAPSQAATGYLYEGNISINSYYGWVSGQAYIPYGSQNFVSVNLYYRDNRTDTVCTVVHMRGVYGSGAVTGWRKVGTSCSTTSNSYGSATIYAPSGQWFNNAQVRVCQSDRYGNVIGTCSAAVAPPSWRIISYTY